MLILIGGLLGPGPDAARAKNMSDGVVSKALLDHANLTMVWQTVLPVRAGERLDMMLLSGDRLYVRSRRNYVWSLNRNDGDVIFSRSIAAPSIPVLGWQVHGNGIVTVIGGQLVELDVETGLERRISDLELGIVGPVVRNSRFFYISAADRRLHVLRVRDLVEVFKAAAENDSLITTVLAGEDAVVFGTDQGNLIALMADAPRKLWQFDAAGPITGSLVHDGGSFYFASQDTNVYRVDIQDASRVALGWRCQTEAVLDRGPRLTYDTVYQYASGRGLTAIDKPTGRPLWSLPEGLDLMAEAAGRAYVITKFRTLVVMDNIAGKKLYAVNFAAVVKHAANTMDAKIYVVDERGRIACLEPIP